MDSFSVCLEKVSAQVFMTIRRVGGEEFGVKLVLRWPAQVPVRGDFLGVGGICSDTQAMAPDLTKASRDPQTLMVLGTIVLILFLIFSLPFLLAVAVFYFARPFLGFKESLLLFVVGVFGFVVLGNYTLSEYGAWLLAMATIPFNDWQWSAMITKFPLVSTPLLTMTITGVLGLLSRTKLGGSFMNINPVNAGRGRPAFKRRGGKFDDEELLDVSKRQEIIARANVVAPPGGGLLINADDHSVLNDKVGERRFPIGLDAQGQPIYLSEREVGTHGVILGSTGSGKTETIKAFAGGLLDLGWSGTIIDLKEDTAPGGLRDWCQQYSQHHSIPYQELMLSDEQSPSWFNALHGMGPDEMRDSILASQQFEAAYYEALNKELLGQLVNLMFYAHEVKPDEFPYPTLYDVARICSAGDLPRRTKGMRSVVLSSLPAFSESDFAVLSSPTKAQAEAASGFGARLGNVFETSAGRAVLRDNAEGTKHSLDVTNEGLTYVGLDSLGKQDLTRVLSSAMLTRMSVYASHRTTGKAAKGRPRFIIVDEANWVNREIVKNLLSRARSAGIALFLATQGPRDWIDIQGDDWDTLGQNLNVAIIMKQNAPDSAEICAQYLGMTKRQRSSQRIAERETLLGAHRVRDADGHLVNEFTVSEELDYRVPPDTLRELRIGEAFIRVSSPESRTDFTRVQMRDPQASPRRFLK